MWVVRFRVQDVGQAGEIFIRRVGVTGLGVSGRSWDDLRTRLCLFLSWVLARSWWGAGGCGELAKLEVEAADSQNPTQHWHPLRHGCMPGADSDDTLY